jgi:hypothetical protein
MNTAREISGGTPRWSRAGDDSVERNVDRRGARASGSLGSIVVNLILLYVAHHVLEWQVGWITPAWSDVLWAIDLMLWVSIAANILFLLFDAAWFRNLGGAVGCGLAVLAMWWLYVVFPFQFGSTATDDLARLVLAALLAATVMATLVTGVLAVVEFLGDTAGT